MFSRIRNLFGTAVLFALVSGATFAERSFAQTNVEILATDLADDAADKADRKDAQDKVNAKIDAATLTGGSVVTFPSGEFEDVGEILIVGKNGMAGTAATTGTAAVAAKPITFRGDGTVFTGKIMFNVQSSTYIRIEGFTFRDTKVPDRITVIDELPSDATAALKDFAVIGSDGDGATTSVPDPAQNGNAAQERSGADFEGDTGAHFKARVENEMGVIWLNPSVYFKKATDPTVYTCPANQHINNITIHGNRFENTSTHGISTRQLAGWILVLDMGGASGLDPLGTAAYADLITNKSYRDVCHSSKLVFSRNTFTGIGYNGDYLGGDKYRDGTGKVPGNHNWKSAIESGGRSAYDWTVSGNTVDGTTWIGIKVNAAFGTTLVESNTVSNTAASGIVVGQNYADAKAAEAKITIRNNRVTNSRNDAYFTGIFGLKSSYSGYVAGSNPSAGMLTTYSADVSDKDADALLEPRVFKRAKGHDKPYIGAEPGDSRLLTSIYADYTGSGYTNGYRTAGAALPAVGTLPGVAVKDSRPAVASNSGTGVVGNISSTAIVRRLKPGIEAGIELNRITAGTIVVENNELTDNVVGLSVCPNWYCYADDDFRPIVWPATLPATFKVPTLTANRIYDNRKDTDMPREFVRADVVNALTEAHTGTGSNVLVLKGNYLGASPEVQGAVNDDDLAMMDDANVGPKETEAPELPSTGGATFTGTTVTLTYGEALDGESVPAAAAFTVTQTASGGLSGTIDVESVAVEGMSVTLTLAKAPGSGNSVTVSYDPAKAGGKPIQDAAGNAAAAIDSRMVAAAAPMEPPEEPMTEEPMTGGGTPPAAAGDGGCALASGGKGGIDLGVLLPLMTLAALSFGLRRGYKESVEIR